MKRIIFTLLYKDGYFIQSRNFRNQNVGDIKWLFENYNFLNISQGIDEIIILNISPNQNYRLNFLNVISEISKKCFVPIAAGGQINDINVAEEYIKSGAEKVVINSLLFEKPNEYIKISKKFGSQCLIANIDILKNIKNKKNIFNLYSHSSQNKINLDLKQWLKMAKECGAGEILIQSIYRDGTGKGVDFDILKSIKKNLDLPLILMGGIGNKNHFLESLKYKQIDAVSTANLLNFVGSTFISFRKELLKKNLPLVQWDEKKFQTLKNYFG